MRSRFSLLIPGAVLLAANAFAEEITIVSAGEHGSYSRIAISGLGQDASATQDGQILRIHGLSQSSVFNLDDVNKYKKAYRVKGGRYVPNAGNPYLEFELSCECQFRPKTSPSGKLVLDISNITKEKIAPTSQASETRPKSVEKIDGNVVFAEKNDDDRLTVEQAQDRMIALLEQAANEGLISMSGATAPTNASVKKDTTEPSHPVTEQIQTTATVAQAHNDVAAHEETPSSSVEVSQFNCINDEALAIDGSQFENDPLYEIANLQTELAQAERGISQEFVEKIAVGFLSIGFGDEALALLDAHSLDDLPIANVARIISERPIDIASPFLGARGCVGSHALWQALADTPEHALEHVNKSGGALNSLPSRLKSLVTKRLAVRMSEAEAWDKAEEYVELAKEILPENDPEIALVEAKLLAYHGDTAASRNALRQIAADGTAASKDALLSLADDYIEDDARAHDGFIEDIGGLAKINGELKPSLIEAVAWANNGNYDAAMLILRNEAKKSTENKVESIKTADRILTKGFAHQSDSVKIDALNAMLENRDWLGEDFWPLEKKNELAQTIAGLGLPNLALTLAGNAADATPEAILRHTKIALDAGEPETAIEIAAPYSDRSEFAEVIVHSNIDLKRYFAALATANNISDPRTKYTLAANAAWAGRDWKSASSAFKELSPNTMTLQRAINFALASYASGEETLPPGADAIIAMDAPALAEGIRSLFKDRVTGSPAERTGALVDLTNKEIEFFAEVLDDG